VWRNAKVASSSKFSLLRLSAKLLETVGAHTQALDIVDRVIKNNAPTANLHLQASRLCLKEGQIDRAVMHWKKAAGAENIGNFLYWLNKIYRPVEKNLCKVQAQQVQFRDWELQQLKSADTSMRNPKNEEAALNDVGVKLLQSQKPADALSIFNALINNGCSDPSIFFNAGLSLSKLSRHGEAVQHYTKAQALGLNSLELLNNKGYSLFHCGQYDEALSCYEVARGMAPRDTIVLSNLASCYQCCGDNKKAMACFNSALSVHPGDDTLENNLGICLENTGDKKAALEHYNRSLLLNPNNTFAKINKAGCLAKLNKHIKALEIYENLLNSDPANHHIWGLKAELLMEM